MKQGSSKNQTELNAKQTANSLIEINFPIAKYEAVQGQRRERLKTFESFGFEPLIQSEKKLISFGEEVLQLLIESKKS